MAIKRSSTKPHKFTADVLLNSNRMFMIHNLDLWQVFVINIGAEEH